MEFSTRLKHLRVQKNLSQKEMAEKLKISNVTLSQYENNVRKPDINTLKFIADVFGVSTDYLLGNTNITGTEKNEQDKIIDEFPEGVDVLRRGTRELSPRAREVMIKHMNQLIDDLAEMERNNKKDED